MNSKEQKRKISLVVLILAVAMTIFVTTWATPFQVPQGHRALVFSKDGKVMGIFRSGINIKPLLAEVTLWPATTTHLISLKYEVLDYDGLPVTISTSIWVDLSRADLIKAARTVGTWVEMEKTLKVWLIDEGKNLSTIWSIKNEGAKRFEEKWLSFFTMRANWRLVNLYNIQIVDVVAAITPRSK